MFIDVTLKSNTIFYLLFICPSIFQLLILVWVTWGPLAYPGWHSVQPGLDVSPLQGILGQVRDNGAVHWATVPPSNMFC